jgi:hypothetical protein
LSIENITSITSQRQVYTMRPKAREMTSIECTQSNV